MKRQKEIEDYRKNFVDKTIGQPSSWPGMTYEEGVQAALDWVLGLMDEDGIHPLE